MNDQTSIITINYNSWEDTIEYIDSIFKIKGNVNLIIIDNLSSDNSSEKIESFLSGKSIRINEKEYKNKEKYIIGSFDYENKKLVFKGKTGDNIKIYYIKNDKNVGFSKGNNIGLEFVEKDLKSKYCWILNNDVIIDNNSIKNQIELSKKYNDKVFIGSTIIEYYDRNKIQCTSGFTYNKFLTITKKCNKGKNVENIYKLKNKSKFISGCSIFSATKNWKEVNNFSEDYFLYFEEMDLAKKISKLKLKSIWCKNSYIYHKEGKSIGSKNIRNRKSAFSEYHGNLSCIIFNHKFFGKFAYIFLFNRYILKKMLFAISGDKKLSKELDRAYHYYYKEVRK